MKKEVKSRTYNSIVNSAIGIMAALITIILNFFVRIVIVKQLGEEITGIHSLFQSITNTIALIEAGFSTAMIIHLYKPVKEKKHREIRATLKFYKKVYFLISFAFIAIGLILNTFFIDDLVKSSISLDVIRRYFMLFILITPANYLTYYKISMLFAEQNNKIYSIVSMLCQIIFRTLQIILVFVFHNYYLFLLMLILEKVVCNLICTRYVNKNNEYLKIKDKEELSKEEKKKILATVRPIFVNNLASNIQNSSKEILISLLLSNVSIVGYFGNYQLVASTAKLLFSQFGAAITSSFGNLAVEKDIDKMYFVYRKVSFVLNWIAIILCTGFLCCIQDFIIMIFGANFVLPNIIVGIIVFELYIYLLGIPVISVQNAMGLHKEDQYMMIFQAVLSIVLGFILGKIYGMIGIFVGLFIPQFIFTLINKGIVINRKAFNKKPIEFLKLIFTDILKGSIVMGLSLMLTMLISSGNLFIDLILKGIISIIITIILFFIISRNNIYYKDVIKLFKFRGKKV